MMRSSSPPPPGLRAHVHGYIAEVEWVRLQPVPYGPLDTTRLDIMVAQVRAWNLLHPTNRQGLRLRILSGVHAPDWVKAMSGGPVHVRSNLGVPGTVPRWWTAPVEQAFAAFIAKLAAWADPIAEVREATVGATMLYFDEIFIRFHKQDAAALLAAGFTQAADLQAMQASFVAYRAFKKTTTQIDVNAYELLRGNPDLDITRQMMDAAVAAGLAHLQFTNAELDAVKFAKVRNLMARYGPKGSNVASLSFQTLPFIGNLGATLAAAVAAGACSVELPDGANPGVVAYYDGLLAANAPR